MVAKFDRDRMFQVFDWPLRDLFLAYLEAMRDAALANYNRDVLVWATLAPHQRRQTKPPDVPRVLRG